VGKIPGATLGGFLILLVELELAAHLFMRWLLVAMMAHAHVLMLGVE